MRVPITLTVTVNLGEHDLDDLTDLNGDLTDGLLMAVGYELDRLNPTKRGTATIDSLTIGTNNLTITPTNQ